ncbi:MAG: hypothetical protein PHQ75_06505 [Thermoguttaceae bacterium]|nr:hypothetical protein [Thermoguttaceae bacterium]
MKYCWIVLLLFAFALRFGAAWYWENRFIPAKAQNNTQAAVADQVIDGPFFFGDSDSYWKLGRAIAFGHDYEFDAKRHWTVFRMPGYPLLLAPWFWVYGPSPPTFPARIVNSVLGTSCVALLGLLAFLIFRDRRVAFLAGCVAAIEPCGILQSVSILSESAFSVALLVQLILFVPIVNYFFKNKGVQSGGAQDGVARFVCWKSGAILGFVWAISVYFRPSWLYFIPMFYFVVGAGLAFFRAHCSFFGAVLNRDFWKLVLSSFVVFCVVMSPWWIRNACVTGRFVPTTLQLGASLYDGLSPVADGSSNMSFVDHFREEEQRNPFPGMETEHFEVRLDQRLKNASLDWSWNHPKEVLELAGVKFLRLWNVVPNEPSFSSRPVQLIIFLSYTPILFFAVIGLFLRGKPALVWFVLLFPAFYLTFLHVIFVSSLRYRTPALLVLIVLAAWAIVQLVDRFGKAKCVCEQG